jgi:hypothetical protein
LFPFGFINFFAARVPPFQKKEKPQGNFALGRKYRGTTQFQCSYNGKKPKRSILLTLNASARRGLIGISFLRGYCGATFRSFGIGLAPTAHSLDTEKDLTPPREYS